MKHILYTSNIAIAEKNKEIYDKALSYTVTGRFNNALKLKTIDIPSMYIIEKTDDSISYDAVQWVIDEYDKLSKDFDDYKKNKMRELINFYAVAEYAIGLLCLSEKYKDYERLTF